MSGRYLFRNRVVWVVIKPITGNEPYPKWNGIFRGQRVAFLASHLTRDAARNSAQWIANSRVIRMQFTLREAQSAQKASE